MKIRPDELAENGYVLLDLLEHKELIPFIRTYIKKRTKYSVFYNLCNVILLMLLGFYFVKGYNLPSYSIETQFFQISIAIVFALFLIPIHEYIHILAYKSQGATKTSFDVNLKKFFFVALADKFVANKKEFEVVALAPFIVISTTLLILLITINSNWTLAIIATLLAHTTICSGDFGLLSYFEYHKKKQVVTYDDVEKKVSYFYRLRDEIKPTV